MKQRISTLATLLLLISISLIACRESSSITCKNCSATNQTGNNYCSNCGYEFSKNESSSITHASNTETSTDNTIATAAIINEATLLDALQGYWAYANKWEGCEVISFVQDKITPFTYPAGGGGPTGTIKSIKGDSSTFEITLYYPDGYDQGDYYPEREETCRLSSIDNYTSKLNVRFASGEQYDYVFVGKTENEYKKKCDNIIVQNKEGQKEDKNDNTDKNAAIINSQDSVTGKWNASYIMYTGGGMNNLKGTHYTLELFSDGTGIENFLGEVRKFKWTLQKDNDGLSGNIQFGTLTPAWLYYRGSNLIIDTGSSQTFFSRG